MVQDVILVNYTGRRGAGPVFAYEMTKGLLENGSRVIAIVSKDIENISLWKELGLEKLYQIETYSSNVTFVMNTIKFLIMKKNILKEFKEFNITAIYCPMIQPWTGLINNLYKKSKSIVTIHDPKMHSGEKNIILEYLMRKTILQAEEIILLSRVFKEEVANRYEKDLEHIHIIPHGVFDYYKNLGVGGREELNNQDKRKTNFMFFGRISKYKGLHILATAYRNVVNQDHNMSLTVAGSGDFKEFHQEYRGLPNITIINKWFEEKEIGKLFERPNTILVLPYIDATQSGVIAIAMEYKIPIIASNTGGLGEQLLDGEIGLLTKVGDARDLEEKMMWAHNNSTQMRQIADKAYAQRDRLSWRTLSKQLKGVIEKV